MLEQINLIIYQFAQFANQLVNAQLTEITPITFMVILMAGLLTSLTPCTLSMLPITIGYIGAYEAENRWQAAQQSTFFCLGLATTLAGLGITAGIIGQVYGQIGFGLPFIVSAIAILMGLNLLEILPLKLPDFADTDWISPTLPKGLRSYLIGLTFGLIASPCSTPVLATLLAWVASNQNFLLGGLFLLAYTLGYVAPLIIAGTFTATIKKLLELRQWSAWINPASGVLLIVFGVFSFLSRI